MAAYDDSLLQDLPKEVLDAALLVGRYFAERNIQDWRLGPCASRALLERIEEEHGIAEIPPASNGPLSTMLRVIDELDPANPKNLRRHMLKPGQDGLIRWPKPLPFRLPDHDL